MLSCSLLSLWGPQAAASRAVDERGDGAGLPQHQRRHESSDPLCPVLSTVVFHNVDVSTIKMLNKDFSRKAVENRDLEVEWQVFFTKAELYLTR